MKNIIRISAIALLMVIAACLETSAKPKEHTLYMFGISCDYNDSTMYLTDIQKLSPMYIESKTGFLYDRAVYTQQLQIFIEENVGKPLTTCVVFFSKSEKKLEKKMIRVMKKAKTKEKLVILPLVPGSFKFTPQEWTEHEEI